MIKKYIFITLSLILTVNATSIKLSQKEIETWQIKAQKVKIVESVPLGSFLVRVTTPPQLMRTISLPFKAQVVSLNAALYQKVKKGDLLAKVTGGEWIQAQQKAVADAIELAHHTRVYKRKSNLCKEKIIPQKECIAALAELKTDKIKVSAAKALLKSYGANEQIIKELFEKFKIKRTLPIYAPTSGTIIAMKASIGESTDPSSAMFVIQKKGNLWLESDLPENKSRMLKEGEKVILYINGKKYLSHILHIAPVFNPQNQTRHVRFSLKEESELLPGMRAEAIIVLFRKAIRIPKKAVIKLHGKHAVFVKKENSFEPIIVKIIGEDEKYYYLKPQDSLNFPIVTTAVAVLKNMVGESDE